MTTSGTVATTVIDTAKVIEHAVRRIGKPASSQTPEGIDIAKECTYLFLLGLANRGFNLWCVERSYIALTANTATYATPAGTIDVLNVVYSQPTQATGTDTVAALSTITALAAATTIVRVGLAFSVITASETVVISSSDDNVTYTARSTQTKTDWATGTKYWFQLDPTVSAQYWKVSTTAASTASTFYLASAIYDLPVTIWNRDTFMALNDKTKLGRPSTNYFFEKTLTPQITLWPVPNNSNDQITIMRHRQVQDVGTLVQTLELPARWFDAMIWQLASKLCFELEDVDPNRMQMVLDQADKNLLMAEGNESDGATIMLSPNISVYT